MIKKNSLPKQIADIIEKDIKNGKYKVGEKIPTEPILVKMFGCSRNTIREAVQSLIHAGLLKACQGNGTFVVAKERIEVDFYELMEEMNEDNILEVRNMLEYKIIELAIKRANERDIENIYKALLERNRMIDRVKENTISDLDFHLSIAYATHNELIVNIYKYVSTYFASIISKKIKISREKEEKLNKLHEDLYSAILNKNVDWGKEIINAIINF